MGIEQRPVEIKSSAGKTSQRHSVCPLSLFSEPFVDLDLAEIVDVIIPSSMDLRIVVHLRVVLHSNRHQPVFSGALQRIERVVKKEHILWRAAQLFAGQLKIGVAVF